MWLNAVTAVFTQAIPTDVERRLEEHNAGQGAKYTRGRLPVKLRHQESFKNRSLAQKREYEIKQLPRSKKEELLD